MDGRISKKGFIKWLGATMLISVFIFSGLNLLRLDAYGKNKISKACQKTLPLPSSDIIIKLSDPKYTALQNVNGSVLLDDDDILIRTSVTQFVAVSLICTYKVCTVELTGGQFVCPCCGSEFDLSGKVTHGPATKNLKTWETTYDSDKGIVTVKMDKKK